MTGVSVGLFTTIVASRRRSSSPSSSGRLRQQGWPGARDGNRRASRERNGGGSNMARFSLSFRPPRSAIEAGARVLGPANHDVDSSGLAGTAGIHLTVRQSTQRAPEPGPRYEAATSSRAESGSTNESEIN